MPIIFLIIINRVLNIVLKSSFLVISLFFVDNLEFIVFANSVNKIVKTVKKVAKTVDKSWSFNKITYKKLKIKAVFFSKLHKQQLNKRLKKAKIKISIKKILFNKKVFQYLRISLNSKLKFIYYINEKIRKSQIVKINMKRLTNLYNLIPRFIW